MCVQGGGGGGREERGWQDHLLLAFGLLGIRHDSTLCHCQATLALVQHALIIYRFKDIQDPNKPETTYDFQPCKALAETCGGSVGSVAVSNLKSKKNPDHKLWTEICEIRQVFK